MARTFFISDAASVVIFIHPGSEIRIFLFNGFTTFQYVDPRGTCDLTFTTYDTSRCAYPNKSTKTPEFKRRRRQSPVSYHGQWDCRRSRRSPDAVQGSFGGRKDCHHLYAKGLAIAPQIPQGRLCGDGSDARNT